MRDPNRSRAAFVLELDPDLGSRLSDQDREQARRMCLANVMDAPEGEWKPPAPADDHRDDIFGLILVRGILRRQTTMGHHETLELLCPGDVLLLPATATDDVPLVPTGVNLSVLSRLTVLVLGTAFLRCANRWPALLSAVLQRVAAQQHRLASQSLALHLPRAEHRILLTLWLLAQRCGNVTPDGVALPLAFTHETLSRVTGARRPTVSLALSSLRRSGCLILRDDGRLILTEQARQEIVATAVQDDRPRIATDTTSDPVHAAA